MRQGAYKKISASFFSTDSPRYPAPGTLYLRHVGFLGAQPPAVKGLAGVTFGEGEEGVVQFAAPLAEPLGLNQLARIVRNLREFLLDKFDREQANDVVPDYLVEELEERARRPALAAVTGPAYAEAPLEPACPAAPEPPTAPAPQATALPPQGTAMTPEQLAQAEAELAARQADVERKEAAFAERETRLAAVDQAQAALALGRRLDELIQAGRVLPADRERLLSFMAALDQEQTVSFGEGEGAATRSARDCLFEYLAAQPPRVDFGERSRGEPERVDAQDTGALANAAIAYREARARAGIDISITQAVADVMAGKQPA